MFPNRMLGSQTDRLVCNTTLTLVVQSSFVQKLFSRKQVYGKSTDERLTVASSEYDKEFKCYLAHTPAGANCLPALGILSYDGADP